MPPLSRQWCSLDWMEADSAFLTRAAHEFPSLAEALTAPQDRRGVLKLMAAAFAMGGLGGCDGGAPDGHLVPAVKEPANIIPGLPNLYSTANVTDGYATGVVVKHEMGRPIKVEGNPLHPASLGATDVFSQAEVLNFYDPDRRAAITAHGIPTSRPVLLTALAAERASIAKNSGAGFRILTGTVTSPTLAAQLDGLVRRYPEARWHQWQAVSRANVSKGAVLAYGQPVSIVPKLDAVDVLLAIDSDLLSSAPGHLRFARDFTSRRNPTRTQKVNRLYAVESTPTLTGSAADHRFVAGPGELHRIVATLASTVVGGSSPAAMPDWITPVIADLTGNRGRSLVHVGPEQPPEIHALIHAVNERLGGRGATFEVVDPIAHGAAGAASLHELVEDMQAGKVTSLLIIDSNPVYSAPGALGFADALKKVNFSLALAATSDETSAACAWFVPMTHPWESWSDARAYDGTATILQPQALPLYNGTSPHQMLAFFEDPSPADPLEIVQTTWRDRLGGDFAQGWHEALAHGVIPDTAAAKATATIRPDAAGRLPPAPADRPLTVLFRPDPYLWDGRHANNAWLQELPRPLTKLTWDNPLLVSPKLAGSLKLRNGDKVRLSIGGAKMTVPVWIVPGQAPDCAVALLGFGRRRVGHVGEGAGFDFTPMMGREDAPSLEKIEGHVDLASTEHHDLLFDASGTAVKHGTLAEFHTNPTFAAAPRSESELYRWKPKGPAAWAMSIDLNACIGCNACVVACQAENNIPVVGKEQVLREREMHWLRIDRYYEGTPDEPESFFQPMLCMQCEQAPCEVVCPVGATVHDAEGLNVMVYNRCVGTRFCSNNCPYKVRRFNYFAYAAKEGRPAQSRNPDVSVRGRGVMEKCTFCLQRIADARIAADRDGRPVGEVVTACQAACPTQAFTFGNQADHDSAVAERKRSPLNYALLEDQNTHPRVTYEARVHNPNPAIAKGGG